jgi:hypothetical protein
MTQRSLYVVETGELTGLSMTGDAALLALNTPAGHAWVSGAHDCRRFVVRLVTDDHGEQQPVVDPRTPARPADNDYQTWAWDDAAGDWRAAPTLAALKIERSVPVIEQLVTLDARARRPTEEITQALALGESPPAPAMARLQAIRANKDLLRQQLAAFAAATSTAALDEAAAMHTDQGEPYV